MKKLVPLFAPVLLTLACAHRESAPASVHSAASPAPASVSATPPKPKPLADGAYRAELSFAQPASASATRGAKTKFVIRIRNAGTGIFPSKPSASGLRDEVRLSYHILNAKNRTPMVFDGLRTNLPADLPAGASIDLPIEVLMPGAPGSYLLVFDLVHEDVSWFEMKKNPILSVAVKVA